MEEDSVQELDPKRIQLLADELEIELSRVDHATAARNILVDPATGEPVEMSPMHYEWHDLADKHPLVELIAHRDAGKTEQMIVARAISELGRNPNLRIKIVCESDDLAKSRISAIGTHIEKNPRVHQIFPKLRSAELKEWNKHKLVVERDIISKDGSVEAYGVLSSGIGGRADILMLDDVCGFKNTLANPGMRPLVINALMEQWFPMMPENPRGRAIYVSTPWHITDATHVIEQNPEWITKRYPVTNFQSPWIQRSPEFFKGRLRLMGARAYARAYELKALSDEEATFTEEMVTEAYDQTLRLGASYPLDWPRVTGIDLASSLGVQGKFTVMFTAVVRPDGVRLPLEIQRGKYTFDDTVDMIINSWHVHKQSLIMVENNAYQTSIQQHLNRRYPYIPVDGWTTGVNKHHMELGLPGFQIMLRNRSWPIPFGNCDNMCECIIQQWVGEMLTYPAGDTSDILMAWWLAECATRRMYEYVDQIVNPEEAKSTVVLNPAVLRYDNYTEEERELLGLDEEGQQPPAWLGSKGI